MTDQKINKGEKQLKGLTGIKKEKLIKSINPTWEDLSLKWF